MLFPQLDSIDHFSLCGPIEYELKDPALLASTTMLFSETAGVEVPFAVDPTFTGIVTLVRDAPTDNSAPMEVEIQTDNYMDAYGVSFKKEY